CGNCGAPLEEGADGQSVRCAYCGAAGRTAVDPVKLAASLRADAHGAAQLMERLAGQLEGGLPEAGRGGASGGPLGRGGGRARQGGVEAFEAVLGDHAFRMRRHRGAVVAERAEMVRGIAVKTEPMSVDSWLDALAEAVSAQAGSRAVTLDALKRLGR